MIWIDALTIALLMYCVVINENPLRYRAAYCSLVVLAASKGIFYFGPYDWLVGVFGEHVYFSICEAVFILLLVFRAAKLAILLMGLGILAIIVNAIAYWVDLYVDATTLFEVLMWVLFAAQLALLLSKRLTNGVYGSLASISLVRFDPRRMYQHTTEGQVK
jgi:hypothetical protein